MNIEDLVVVEYDCCLSQVHKYPPEQVYLQGNKADSLNLGMPQAVLQLNKA